MQDRVRVGAAILAKGGRNAREIAVDSCQRKPRGSEKPEARLLFFRSRVIFGDRSLGRGGAIRARKHTDGPRKVHSAMSVLAHREAVGGLWEEMGRLQFDFLVGQGLQPHHKLLDIGCGSMRGGRHFVAHLDPGNYFGVDRDAMLLSAGKSGLAAQGLLARKPVLREIAGFDFSKLGTDFDFLLAQSVFTHLDLNSIMRCLVNASRTLAPGGRFFATFFVSRAGFSSLEPIRQPTRDGREVVTHCDRDPYHYAPSTLEWLAQNAGLHCRYIGDWSHPRNQMMLEFSR